MTTLCIETSTSVCSAAWCIDGQCVAERIHQDGSNHAALLPLFIQQLLAEAKQHNWHADAVAVSEGPGSYTGLRIGLSTAKGLCFGWNVPLIPIPTLDILCQSALTDFHPSPFTTQLSTYLVPMLDARRMEVYTALYPIASSPNRLIAQSPIFAQIVDNTTWLPQDSEIYFFGDGASKCQAVLQGKNFHFIDQIIPRASVMGALIQNQSYPTIGEKELAYYTPFYLKEFIAAPSHIKGLK